MYPYIRGSWGIVEQARFQPDGSIRTRMDSLPALSGGIVSGAPWNSQIEINYSYNFGIFSDPTEVNDAWLPCMTFQNIDELIANQRAQRISVLIQGRMGLAIEELPQVLRRLGRFLMWMDTSPLVRMTGASAKRRVRGFPLRGSPRNFAPILRAAPHAERIVLHCALTHRRSGVS